MKEFTQKHQRVLDYIRRCVDDGVPPTVREICDSLGIKSTSTGHKYLRELEEMAISPWAATATGASAWWDGRRKRRSRCRCWVLLPPVCPFWRWNRWRGMCPLRRDGMTRRSCLALRVKGESMIEAGILDGDIIIARRTPVAENGQIVVAIVGDEATVKTFYKEKGHFRLQPENSTMEPIIVTEAAILGKVISVVRNYE